MLQLRNMHCDIWYFSLYLFPLSMVYTELQSLELKWIVALLSGYPDPNTSQIPTDSDIIKLVFLTLASYIYKNVQPQAQYLCHIFTVLMLTSNTVSNHKSYFDMQNAFLNCLK